MSIRPAGMSDDSDSDDDYGFYDRPVRRSYNLPQENIKKKIETALQNAVINGCVKDVEKIINYDLHSNFNDKLDTGWTPLMHACFHAQEEIVSYLLKNGADPNIHSDSVTPIMLACSNSNSDDAAIENLVKELISKGAILNIGDKYGQTPLMRAVGSGRVKLVEMLLDERVNIEMRDQKGWTALFAAVHYNQPEILEILIANGARITEIDRSSRTPLEIAYSHNYEGITEILNKHILTDNEEEEDNSFVPPKMESWYDYYPGLSKGESPNYAGEIHRLLYGMNCERLSPIFVQSGMSLRDFLLLEEKDMLNLGIKLPYERQRLVLGLRKFHSQSWKLNAVAGFTAPDRDKFSVLDCLTTLGNHLQQLYILEATLHYTLRSYNKVQSQLKFEPPDSPIISKLTESATKNVTNIVNIRREVKNLKNLLSKISKNNPPPADLLRDKSFREKFLDYASKAAVVCTVGLIAINAKVLFSMLKK